MFVLCGNFKKISPYIHLMLLLHQSSGIVYPFFLLLGGGGGGGVDRKLVQAPQQFLLQAVPRRLLCFGSLVILDMARCYLWLFTLYINTQIGKNSC